MTKLYQFGAHHGSASVRDRSPGGHLSLIACARPGKTSWLLFRIQRTTFFKGDTAFAFAVPVEREVASADRIIGSCCDNKKLSGCCDSVTCELLDGAEVQYSTYFHARWSFSVDFGRSRDTRIRVGFGTQVAITCRFLLDLLQYVITIHQRY